MAEAFVSIAPASRRLFGPFARRVVFLPSPFSQMGHVQEALGVRIFQLALVQIA